MGRTSDDESDLEGQLFQDLPESKAPNPFDIGADGLPAWSVQKSEIVARYLELYQLITRGGFYIDGFAAPQRRELADDLWTAKKVLEITPKRIRRFWLCDMDRTAEPQLRSLQKAHEGPSRRVSVFIEDFNTAIDTILIARWIKRSKSSCFAFLDQRGTECHWATLKKLADHRPKRRIELLYLFPAGWVHRTMKGATTKDGRATLDAWWGRNTWMEELGPLKREEQARLVQRRFETELGYSYVLPVPIRKEGAKGVVLYYLMHASDHPEANKLMRRAYRQVSGHTVEGHHENQIDMDRIWRK